MKITEAENKIMLILWDNDEVFMKDIIESYPEPQPAKSTIATMLKRMFDKKLIDYKVYGNSRAYFPLIKKEDYCKKEFKGFMNMFFGNSATKFASYFTANAELSQEDLKKLRDLIDKEINE